MISKSDSLIETVGFELLGPSLGKDLKSSIQDALTGGAVFSNGDNPLGIYRQALAASIRNIELHSRGRCFQEFLIKDPYEDVGDIPPSLVDRRISDADTDVAITFIYSHMVVNSFKGAVTELPPVSGSPW